MRVRSCTPWRACCRQPWLPPRSRGGVSGAELIVAVAVGVDIAAGLGLASRAGFRFFRPATAGGFGAVAAAGRLLGLDRRALEAAFAWQLAQVSGTMQAHAEGSPLLPVQVAFNARAALQSCELAALDFTPTRSVFEGPYGYLALFEGDFDLEPVLSSLGRDWRISELSHKPFPAGRATHGGIEGVDGVADPIRVRARRCRAHRGDRATADRAPGWSFSTTDGERNLRAALHGIRSGQGLAAWTSGPSGLPRRRIERSCHACLGRTGRDPQ